jgi:hypothetical protein
VSLDHDCGSADRAPNHMPAHNFPRFYSPRRPPTTKAPAVHAAVSTVSLGSRGSTATVTIAGAGREPPEGSYSCKLWHL